MSSTRLFPLALVSALLLSTAVLAQGGGGGGAAVAVELVVVVPVEVLARAVLPANAAPFSIARRAPRDGRAECRSAYCLQRAKPILP